MNIFQFIASLTGSLAWPIVVVLTVLLLRKPLAHIIVSLQKLKVNYQEKDIELNFGEQLGALEERANIPLQETKNSPEIVKVEVQTEEGDKLKTLQEDVEKKLQDLEEQRSSEKSEVQTQPETKRVVLELQRLSLEVEKQRLDLESVLEEIKLRNAPLTDESSNIVAEYDPIGAIVLSWSQLQAEIMSIVIPLWAGTHFPPSIVEAIRYLRRIAIKKGQPFDNETVAILESMRILRNKAVYDIDETKITYAEALEYVRLAQRMLAVLKPLKTAVQEINLATLSPREFELLVQELFGRIFAEKKGSVHPARQDRGFDAIGIDPDPIHGGTVLIQIKQYRGSVSVSVVRDFAGAIQFEKATKGILVTTSTFTTAAIEAAKNLPIELIDGTKLLSLLQTYGYNTKIDFQSGKNGSS